MTDCSCHQFECPECKHGLDAFLRDVDNSCSKSPLDNFLSSTELRMMITHYLQAYFERDWNKLREKGLSVKEGIDKMFWGLKGLQFPFKPIKQKENSDISQHYIDHTFPSGVVGNEGVIWVKYAQSDNLLYENFLVNSGTAKAEYIYVVVFDVAKQIDGKEVTPQVREFLRSAVRDLLEKMFRASQTFKSEKGYATLKRMKSEQYVTKEGNVNQITLTYEITGQASY